MTRNHPHSVRTDGGTFRSEHPTIEIAERVAAECNTEAEKLGIKTRYVATTDA